MGGGIYSSVSARATSNFFSTQSRDEVFEKRTLDSEMNPKGVKFRESLDTEEHPNTVPIILGLDVTGSMGIVPERLVKEGLPHIMDAVIEAGIADPQLLFMGIGDHKCDRAPLQVGQFESSDKLLNKWLTALYLEGGGGGNGGESYLLAWYFAAYHTKIDSWDKRKKKGFLFTIGDEPNHRDILGRHIKDITGNGDRSDMTAASLLAEAQKKYNVYHVLITDNTGWGRDKSVKDGWTELLGKNVITVTDYNDVAKVIARTIKDNTDVSTSVITKPSTDAEQASQEEVIL